MTVKLGPLIFLTAIPQDGGVVLLGKSSEEALENR
jgi:hypothetical protein